VKPKIFIDGQEGTTGLQIVQRLEARRDIELLRIDERLRRDERERRRLINSADIVFLCLPDDAARESVALIDNDFTRVIDASTAHRTSPGWAYGFPELSSEHRVKITSARYVANPGCHATGFLSIVYPLARLGLISPDCAGISCFSLTGYSGGGKKMIAEYENAERPPELSTPGIYGVAQSHKHISEMMSVAGLTRKPVFCPVVGDYYAGMATSVMFPGDLLGGVSPETLCDALSDWYSGSRCVTVDAKLGAGTLYADFGVGTNALRITVSGDDAAKLITARFDNLGKGASGAAVQNMNLMLGFDELEGLKI
jgi:N-acetyl-gamma-glutamyl-phosphate reductase